MESESQRNPYLAPQSRVEEIPDTVIKAVYSPAQGAFGTFLGGPLPGLYFLKSNFDVLGNSADSTATLLWGSISLLLFILLAPFIPEQIPKFIFPLAMAWAIRILIEKKQFSKEYIQSTPNYRFQSNWKVVGISLLGAAIQIAIIIGVIFFYYSIGVLHDA